MKLDKAIEVLKEKHGRDLSLKDDVYYLFGKDFALNVYLDEGTLKVDIEMLPENHTFVYQTDLVLDDLFGGEPS